MTRLLLLCIMTYHLTVGNPESLPAKNASKIMDTSDPKDVIVYTENSNTSSNVPVSGETPKALTVITHVQDIFASKLYETIHDDVPGNFVFSPISVFTALSMLAQGAGGHTAKQMNSVLGLTENNNITTLGFQTLNKIRNNTKQMDIRLAIKLFIRHGCTVKSTFNNVTRTTFNSEAQSLDFLKPDEASKIVNNWVALQTNNRITKLVRADSFTSNTVIVIVNAVYFKGTWKTSFDIEATKNRPFYVNGTTTRKDIPTMYVNGRFKYGELPEVKSRFVELPYKIRDSNVTVSMFVILPTEKNGLPELERNFHKVTVDRLIQSSTEHDVHIYLPKFSIEKTLELNEPIRQMGLSEIFSSSANFSGIADNATLYVSKIVQKAFIDCNEAGTEAAAVLEVTIVEKFANVDYDEPSVFIADHPFIAIIAATNHHQGVNLFTIRYSGPIS